MSEVKLTPTGRIDYSRATGKYEIPYLVEAQTTSYAKFIDSGLETCYKNAFPIVNTSGTLKLDYISHEIEAPSMGFLEAKERNGTYESKVNVTFRLSNMTTGEFIDEKVYLGTLPRMTNSGTFIINGNEKAVSSQIVRAPGCYMVKDELDKDAKQLYKNDIIPSHGAYLQFFSTSDGLEFAINNSQKSMNAVLILYTLGLKSRKEIIDLFGENRYLIKTLDKYEIDKSLKNANTSDKAISIIMKLIKPTEPTPVEGAFKNIRNTYFDPHKYDLSRTGRYTFQRKLNIYDRLIGLTLAEDLLSDDKKVIVKKDTEISKELARELKEKGVFEKNKNLRIHALSELIGNQSYQFLDDHDIVNVVKVYKDGNKDNIYHIVGSDNTLPYELNNLTISDIFASFSYFLNILDGFGEIDDIDNLKNRRIRCVGELAQEAYKQGLGALCKSASQKLQSAIFGETKIPSLINIKNVETKVHEFFVTSQLSKFMDQTNPLSELTEKRRISALGRGGIAKERATGEVRDVHETHYGRICPVETPEGQTVGLINTLASYARIDEYGFITTPYRKVIHKNGKAIVTEDVIYLAADKEVDHYISGANVNISADGVILDERVVGRHEGETILISTEDVDLIDVSPKQIVSVAAACIPFLGNDDATRALMGSNMQRQAVPLIKPTTPYVGTGMEYRIAHDAGLSVVAVNSGTVTYVDAKRIDIKEKDITRTYKLRKFERSNKATCINQTPIVKVGDKVKANQIIADGPAMDNGDLALGQNVLVAFTTWNGYNYEDAVIMSERLVKDDTYTSIHIEKYQVDVRTTKAGDESITRDIPKVGEDKKKFLDSNGIIAIGAEVKEDDILVGKITPYAVKEIEPIQQVLKQVYGEKGNESKDTSLRVPHGGAGIVVDVKRLYAKTDKLPNTVNETVFVYIAQKRKISEGDKMSGRHGNKGVISRILPVEDMPYLPDGTPIDIMLNPLGVPSRMNIGQILELHLGLACRNLNIKVANPVFEGMDSNEITKLMDEAGLEKDGKTVLYDGRTGERFDERISVGIMYMIKLDHMVDDKLHARSVGPYSAIHSQPLGGKAQKGGQRLGEMEVWALEAYGAAHILQEMITIKSDDRVGRNKAYANIVDGKPLPHSGIPEAFRVLIKELQGLCINVNLFDSDDKKIDLNALAAEVQKEEQISSSSLRGAGSKNVSVEFDEDDGLKIVSLDDKKGE